MADNVTKKMSAQEKLASKKLPELSEAQKALYKRKYALQQYIKMNEQQAIENVLNAYLENVPDEFKEARKKELLKNSKKLPQILEEAKRLATSRGKDEYLIATGQRHGLPGALNTYDKASEQIKNMLLSDVPQKDRELLFQKMLSNKESAEASTILDMIDDKFREIQKFEKSIKPGAKALPVEPPSSISEKLGEVGAQRSTNLDSTSFPPMEERTRIIDINALKKAEANRMALQRLGKVAKGGALGLGALATASDIADKNEAGAALDVAETGLGLAGKFAGRAAPFLELLRPTPTQTQEQEEEELAKYRQLNNLLTEQKKKNRTPASEE